MADENFPPPSAVVPPCWIDRARLGMAFLLVTAFIGAIVALTYFTVPIGNKDTIYLMVGILGGWGGNTIQFFFGSQVGKDGRDQQRETRLLGMAQKREGQP